MTEILLVRHGHVEGISPERFRGRADLPLTAEGRRATEAREWFADNRYQDYLYLHGLSVEMAEAFAEYVPQADPRRVEPRRRGSPRHRGGALPRLPRQPIFLRLPRLSQPRRPEAAIGATTRRGNRHHPQRRRPARPRTIHLRHRPPPPPGQIFFSVGGDTQDDLARAGQHIAQSRACFPKSYCQMAGDHAHRRRRGRPSTELVITAV
jgi:hypothetical protein